MAGLAIPAGAWLGRIERLRSEWLEKELRHSIIAFGGGILLAAVALALVPEGLKHLSTPVAAAWFLGGGLVFCGIDIGLSRLQSSGAQLVAVLSDFVPEAIALGAAGATGSSLVLLLAILMALQNFPEGFNAYRELAESDPAHRKRLPWLFLTLVPLGPASGAVGFLFLADSPAIIGALMLVASGGILYLVFQDIAPQAKLDRAFAPPLGAVLGFLFGLVCHQLVG